MNKKGFSLVELIAVIAIIGLLVVLVVPVVIKYYRSSEERFLEIQKSKVKEAAELYLLDYCDNPLGDGNATENANKYFNGIDDVVTMAPASINLGDAITMALRVKNHKQRYSIIGNPQIAGVDLAYTSSKFLFSVYGASASDYTQLLTDTTYDLNTWYTIVSRYDGNKMSVWVDGVKVKEIDADLNGIKVSPVPFVLGGNPSPSGMAYYHNMSVSYAYLFDRALSDIEITTYFGAIPNVTNKENLISELDYSTNKCASTISKNKNTGKYNGAIDINTLIDAGLLESISYENKTCSGSVVFVESVAEASIVCADPSLPVQKDLTIKWVCSSETCPSTFPSKTDGYEVTNVVCTNDTIASWDNSGNNWKLDVSLLNTPTECTITLKK